MSDQFLAEIRIFGFNFPPRGWAFCSGQLMPISQNTALFSLLGTNYGGDGKSNFGLPDMQGNAPMHWGQGPGLSEHFVGETEGSQTVTLLQTEMPMHTHPAMATAAPANRTTPAGNCFARTTAGTPYVSAAATPVKVPMALQSLAPVGGSQPHNNMMPSLALNFCIALQGIFPQRP